MGSGPTTTTTSDQEEKAKQTANTRAATQATTGVQGTTLEQGTELGQTYGATNQQTAQQGQTANYSAQNAYAPTEPILQDIISQAGALAPAALTSEEQGALSGLNAQAQNVAGYNPQIEAAAGTMLSGGGFGDGDQYVKSGWDSLNTALGGTARGDNLNMESNPYLAGMLSTGMTDAMNKIGSQFAGAGRSFSGAHRDASASAMAEAALPHLFNNYQFERNAQANAGNSLMQGGIGASGALGQNRAGALNAMQAAPDMLAATNNPYTTMLTGSQIGRQIPLDQLGKVSDIIMPMASQFGEKIDLGSSSNVGSTTGETMGTSANQTQNLSQNDVMTMLDSLNRTKSKTKGTTTATGTQVASQENDPLTTLLGAGTMLGGAWLGSDRRMKRDISMVGALDNGLNVYRFRYKDGHEDGGTVFHIGLMADEVEKIVPLAVMTAADGFKRVHYGMATANYTRA
jgi:hypothetical protein